MHQRVCVWREVCVRVCVCVCVCVIGVGVCDTNVSEVENHQVILLTHLANNCNVFSCSVNHSLSHSLTHTHTHTQRHTHTHTHSSHSLTHIRLICHIHSGCF